MSNVAQSPAPNISIKAKAYENGNIEIDTDLVDDINPKIRENISREIVKTKDEAIKNSLIQLGWTPPEGETPIVADKDMLVDAIIGKGFSSEKHHKSMIVYGWANKSGWNREALQYMHIKKLLGIYTEGSLVG